MPVDYDAIIVEMNSQEAELLNELSTLRMGRAAIVQMKKSQQMRAAASASPTKRFTGWGPKQCVLAVLKDASQPMTTGEIYEDMVNGGWKTESEKPMSNLSATLSQMRDKEVVKVGEAWRLTLTTRVSEDEVVDSQPGNTSLAATHLYPNASPRPS